MPVTSAITDEDRKFVETWENIAPFTNAIIRVDPRGVERQELVVGRRNFMVTTEERMITQDRIVDQKLDPFRNGSFRPVLVPDSVDMKSNPNALSDEEIKSILVSSDIAFSEWLKVIDSPETLRRMIELAEESDVSLKRYKEIGGRLAEAKPTRQITQKDREQFEAIGGQASPAPTRGRGGRSADYRNG